MPHSPTSLLISIINPKFGIGMVCREDTIAAPIDNRLLNPQLVIIKLEEPLQDGILYQVVAQPKAGKTLGKLADI